MLHRRDTKQLGAFNVATFAQQKNKLVLSTASSTHEPPEFSLLRRAVVRAATLITLARRKHTRFSYASYGTSCPNLGATENLRWSAVRYQVRGAVTMHGFCGARAPCTPRSIGGAATSSARRPGRPARRRKRRRCSHARATSYDSPGPRPAPGPCNSCRHRRRRLRC